MNVHIWRGATRLCALVLTMDCLDLPAIAVGPWQPTICLGRLSLIERTVRLLAILPSRRKDKIAGVDRVGMI